MVFVGTTEDLIRYLRSLGSRDQIYPPHPLNIILDQLCPHQVRTTKLASRGDPSHHHTCALCGHYTIT